MTLTRLCKFRVTCNILLTLLATTAGAQEQEPAATPPAPPARPVMTGLDAIGLGKPLREINLNVYGFVEGSYTQPFSSQPDNLLFGRVFDFQGEQLMLNQLDLSIERTVDLKKF